MCGICGLYLLDSAADVDPRVVEAMCGTLHHRGPDDRGTLVDGPFGMGMTRLSIVDLETGHQPIFNEDRTIAVVCNGEIYNYPELRAELETRGHVFATRSDCESIVHLYEEFGLEFPKRLRGMFGLALWDAPRRRLVLARDRLGIKPLYVTEERGRLAFASELKAILRLPDVDRAIDPVSLDAYLTLGYVPAPRSIFQGIRKVMPGHMVVADRSGVHTERYWQLRFPVSGNGTRLSERDVCDALRSLMRDTVRSHLLADVPLGVFLSGGIDSSVIVALMSEFVPRLKTFSVGFNEASYDEAHFARVVADRFGTEHHELIVEPAHAAGVGELVSYLDEPFGDLSAIPVYFLSGLARREVKVVLSGDGGDELFGGYLTYIADHLARIYRRIPGPMRDGIRRLAERMPTSFEKVSLDYRAKRFVAVADQPMLESHLGWKQVFSAAERDALYRRDYRESAVLGDPLQPFKQCFEDSREFHFLDRLLHLDISTYLADDILTKVDRMSMAHSLEVRVPFLDHEVVEFSSQIPPSMKLRGFKTKYVVRKAFEDLLPHEIRTRKKAGFIFPASLWLRGPLAEFAGDHLTESRIAKTGLFESAPVRRLLAEHRDGRRDHARAIWNLVVFMAWHRRYVEDAAYQTAAAAT